MPNADVAAPSPVDLVLVGFGSVARRFVRLLATRSGELAAGHGLDYRIVGVATARHGSAVAPDGLDVARLAASVDDGAPLTIYHDARTGSAPGGGLDLLGRVADTRADDGRGPRLIVVENTPLGLDGGQPGVDHVRAAFDLGADVITANKGPAAFAYGELRDRGAGAAFRFEGAVLDGLPVFSLVRETLPSVDIRGFRGIVNTTTNHVLSAMEDGRSLEDAVADMQAAGIAEADATNDIDGWDAAAKTAVLANVLLDAAITPHDVERDGLRSVTAARVRAARDRGTPIKLVASAERRDGAVVAAAGPVEVSADDPLARLSDTAKGLVIDTDLLGPIQISKLVSDVTHTAYGLLADLISIHSSTRSSFEGRPERVRPSTSSGRTSRKTQGRLRDGNGR